MADFATVAQLEAAWRPLTEDEQARAEVLLRWASARLRAECPGIDDRIDAGVLDPSIPEQVVCSAVKRAMIAGDAEGLATDQQTAGPFTHQVTYSNPEGSLYFTKAELRVCGGSRRGRAFMIDLMPPRENG